MAGGDVDRARSAPMPVFSAMSSTKRRNQRSQIGIFRLLPTTLWGLQGCPSSSAHPVPNPCPRFRACRGFLYGGSVSSARWIASLITVLAMPVLATVSWTKVCARCIGTRAGIRLLILLTPYSVTCGRRRASSIGTWLHTASDSADGDLCHGHGGAMASLSSGDACDCPTAASLRPEGESARTGRRHPRRYRQDSLRRSHEHSGIY